MLQEIDTSGRYHFHSYNRVQLEDLRASWRALSIHEDRPEITEVTGGAVAPLNFRGKKNSGVYDAQNALVISSTRFRGEDRVEPGLDANDLQETTKDERDAYYLGCGEKHYGDFLLEVLCRAWAWQEFGRDRIGVMQRPSNPFAAEMYALIPGTLERMKIVRKPTRFRSILVPGPSFVLRRKAHTAFKRLCESMAERSLKSQGQTSEQPVYLSRSGLSSSLRAVLGEKQLEQLLEKEGFKIVRPETLSIADQIALYNRHSWIVSAVGSACHTRVFSLAPNNFVTLAPPLINENYILCDLLCSGTAHFVNALAKPDIGTEFRLRNLAPLMLDRENVLSALKKLSLVRDSAAFEGRPPDVDEYKRQWLAAARGVARGRPPDLPELLYAIRLVSDSLDGGEKRSAISYASIPSSLTRWFRRLR